MALSPVLGEFSNPSPATSAEMARHTAPEPTFLHSSHRAVHRPPQSARGQWAHDID